MQEQRPSIGSLFILMVIGFVGLGVIGFVLLLLLSLIGPWTALLPFIAVGVIVGMVWLKRRQRTGDSEPGYRE